MPLLDHFHAPLSQRRHWDSFHGAWAEAIAQQLNEDLLPDRYFAEARIKLGTRVEIDVGTFDEGKPSTNGAGVAVWASPRPTISVPVEFQEAETFEVQVLNDEEGPRLVAAIELVSPANKDRPANRRAFAIMCASYLQSGVSLMIVDVVTERKGNLHAALLRLLKVTAATPARSPNDLYASAYRTVPESEKDFRLDVWAKRLRLRHSLPTLSLWLQADVSLPVDLEATYQAARAARRI
jgi:hypothetical protein